MWKNLISVAAFAFLAGCSGSNPDYVEGQDPNAGGANAPSATAVGGTSSSSNGGAPTSTSGAGSGAPGSTTTAPGSTTTASGAPGSTTTGTPGSTTGTPGSTSPPPGTGSPTVTPTACTTLEATPPSTCATDQEIADAIDQLVKKCELGNGTPTAKFLKTDPANPACVIGVGLECC